MPASSSPIDEASRPGGRGGPDPACLRDGYVFDPASGFHWHPYASHWFHPAMGIYLDPQGALLEAADARAAALSEQVGADGPVPENVVAAEAEEDGLEEVEIGLAKEADEDLPALSAGEGEVEEEVDVEMAAEAPAAEVVHHTPGPTLAPSFPQAAVQTEDVGPPLAASLAAADERAATFFDTPAPGDVVDFGSSAPEPVDAAGIDSQDPSDFAMAAAPTLEPAGFAASDSPAREPAAFAALDSPAREPAAFAAFDSPAREPAAFAAFDSPARESGAFAAFDSPAREPGGLVPPTPIDSAAPPPEPGGVAAFAPEPELDDVVPMAALAADGMADPPEAELVDEGVVEMLEEPAPAPVPSAAPQGSALLDPGAIPVRFEDPWRVVIHLRSGASKRGELNGADLGSPTVLLHHAGGSDFIDTESIKAIFFMKEVHMQARRPAGRRVRITLSDGRGLEGYAPQKLPAAGGFYVVPVDDRTNTAWIFVFPHAIKDLAFA